MGEIEFYDSVVLKLFTGAKFRENGRKSRNLIPAKFKTFKVFALAKYVNYTERRVTFK